MAIGDIQNEDLRAWAFTTLNASLLADQEIEVAPHPHLYNPAHSENVAAVRDHFGTTSPIGSELLMHATAYFPFDMLPPHAISYLAHLHRERAAQEENSVFGCAESHKEMFFTWMVWFRPASGTTPGHRSSRQRCRRSLMPRSCATSCS